LQALSNAEVLRYVDYLSSVSGGGYIAGHFTALASLYPAAQPATGETTAAATEPVPDRPPQATVATSAASFHDSESALLGLDFGQRLDARQYRFRHMGEYLTDYIGFLWRYVLWTIPLLAWATCLLGIVATVVAIVWRWCDLPVVRAYFDMVGLGRLGSALHLGDEMPMAFLPSLAVFLLLVVLVIVRWTAPEPAKARLRFWVHTATVAWLVSLGISIAVFLGNGETSLGASAQLKKIQSNVTWPLLIVTCISFLPLLAGRQLMQSGREHAPRWKKILFHAFIGGATVSAAFLMVHLMARENISGFASHRDSTLLPEDIYNWSAFLALLGPDTSNPAGRAVPLAGVFVEDSGRQKFNTSLDELRNSELQLRHLGEQIKGSTSWEQWQRIPLLNLNLYSRILSILFY
jgi:hypothetical protein